MPLGGRRRPALPRTSSAVPSALGGLTSGFGMGPGVPPLPWPPAAKGRSAIPGGPGGRALRAAQRDRARRILLKVAKEELGRLVPLGSAPRGASTCGLSTSWSTRGLTEGRTHLWTGFPLRCFQRLSLPNVANRPCRWRDNRHTRGPSTQVLSYYGQASSGFQRAQRIETKLSHDVLNPARVPL